MRWWKKMNQVKTTDKECVICHKVGNDVNVSYGDYDFAHQKCVDIQEDKHQKWIETQERIEPVLIQISKQFLSNDDLIVLKNEIDSIIFIRNNEQCHDDIGE